VNKCDRCGKESDRCELQPTIKGLVFGPFPGSFSLGTAPFMPMERRCPKCEREVAKIVRRMLR